MIHHLGCDFERDPDGTLRQIPRKYITKILDNYEKMFKEKPKEASSPLEKGDHPELDDTELLESEGTTKFQSLIGSLQWLITLGRFDVATAVMTLSRFRANTLFHHAYVSNLPMQTLMMIVATIHPW